MIEASMFLVIGFMIACLFWIAFVPLIHNRAVRLTARRLDQTGPQSLAEVKADKDHLRAEHAIAVSRLETQVLRLQTESTTQRAELGRKAHAIETLKASIEDHAARAREAESRIETYLDRIAVLEQQLAETAAQLTRQEEALADDARKLGKMDEQQLNVETRRVEVAALVTQVEALKTRIDDADRAKSDADNIVAAQRLIIEDMQAKLAATDRDGSARMVELIAARARIAELEAAARAPAPGADKPPRNPVGLVPQADADRPASPLAVVN